jgi:hypothetical protein
MVIGSIPDALGIGPQHLASVIVTGALVSRGC